MRRRAASAHQLLAVIDVAPVIAGAHPEEGSRCWSCDRSRASQLLFPRVQLCPRVLLSRAALDDVAALRGLCRKTGTPCAIAAPCTCPCHVHVHLHVIKKVTPPGPRVVS